MTELGLRTIPGYVVHERLASDLVSETYLAERQADGYPVLLHVIADEFDDAASAAAFFDSHDRMSRIGHPVLPTVWDVGHASGMLYSVTNAVEGRSLADTLAHGGMQPSDVLALCSELADTLDLLHAADVVHGAINPCTVWVNDRSRAPSAPRVTLRGFGTSDMVTRRIDPDQPGPPPDDLLYLAPEQLRREEITGRVDQYALACMVTHCLTGDPPFERATVNALIGGHLFAAPIPGDRRWERLPTHVVDAVQRALSKDPADRFALCSAFATAIGGGRERSWTWMIHEAMGTADDDAGGGARGGPPARAPRGPAARGAPGAPRTPVAGADARPGATADAAGRDRTRTGPLADAMRAAGLDAMGAAAPDGTDTGGTDTTAAAGAGGTDAGPATTGRAAGTDAGPAMTGRAAGTDAATDAGADAGATGTGGTDTTAATDAGTGAGTGAVAGRPQPGTTGTTGTGTGRGDGGRAATGGGDATAELSVRAGDLEVSTSDTAAAELRAATARARATSGRPRRNGSAADPPTAWIDDAGTGAARPQPGTEGPGTGGLPGHRPAAAATDGATRARRTPAERRPPGHEVTIRSLAEADWLPGNSGEPGATDRRTRRDARPARAPARRRGPSRRTLRWAAAAIVTLLMLATIAVLTLRTPAPEPVAQTAPRERAQRTPVAPTVRAVWQRSVTTRRVTSLQTAAGTLLSGSQTGVVAVEPDTGAVRWSTDLDDAVTEVTALDGVVVARSASALRAYDERSGEPLWETTGDGVTPTAMAAGGDTVFEVTPNGRTVRIRALALDTGKVRWTLDDLAIAGGGTWAVYDRSRLGGHMLYVLTGARLHAVDTDGRTVRWRTKLDGPQPASLTAMAGAILVIDEQGQICRYGMRNGDEVWTQCATLQTGPGSDAVLRTRNARVIVRSATEVAGVDFTSGTSHWHVSDSRGFQDAFAANAHDAFVTHDDGQVEAIDHQAGVERWRSQPLGEVTAMTADDTAVYVAVEGGTISRLQADPAAAER